MATYEVKTALQLRDMLFTDMKNHGNKAQLVLVLLAVIEKLVRGGEGEEMPNEDENSLVRYLETTHPLLSGWTLSSTHESGHLISPCELRFHGVLFAQTWDPQYGGWAILEYIEPGGGNIDLLPINLED